MDHRRQKKSPYEQRLIDVRRVARVVKGGKRFKFRVTVVIGDKKGKIGLGTGKGNDVTTAVSKAVSFAEKRLLSVKIINDTIPCEVTAKKGGVFVFLKPAREGTGVIAGGAVRQILALAGIKNVFGKIYGSSNKMNNAGATVAALASLKTQEEILKMRGITKKKEK